MSLNLFWKEHHTLISLALGVLLTFIIFKIPKLKIPYRIIIILIALFLLTGLTGILKYLGLVLIVVAILYGAFVSIWGLGLIAMGWFAASHGWALRWWQIFLICAVWGPNINTA